MSASIEKRFLQGAIIIGCLVPILAGGAGMIKGPAMAGGPVGVATDLDSHFRYLSGLLFGIGLAFLSCVPSVERSGKRLRLLGAIVILGGLGRALSLASLGWPGPGHRFALAMELVATPLLLLWQWRVARRCRIDAPVPKSRGAVEPLSDDPSTWPATGSGRSEDLGKPRLSSPERT